MASRIVIRRKKTFNPNPNPELAYPEIDSHTIKLLMLKIKLNPDKISELVENEKIPGDIKQLILLNHSLVSDIINWFSSRFIRELELGATPENMNAIILRTIKPLSKKAKFVEFISKLGNFLHSTNFFTKLAENYKLNGDQQGLVNDVCDPVYIPSPDNPDNPDKSDNQTKPEKFKLKINQIDALNKLRVQLKLYKMLRTSLHSQCTGAGKSHIILKYMEICAEYFIEPKIIFFTERVNIPVDIFGICDYKTSGGKIKKAGSVIMANTIGKLIEYKHTRDLDITNYTIINRVTNKEPGWAKLLEDTSGPCVLVINRAFLTRKSTGELDEEVYQEYTKLNNLTAIFHDECHNSPSVECYKFLTHFKNKNVPIVGWSATPLRAGHKNLAKLLDIYSSIENPTKLELLTNYNMIYGIEHKLILPPIFHWFKWNTPKNKPPNKQDIANVMGILDSVVGKLRRKKIVGWAERIDSVYMWAEIFETNKKDYANLANFSFWTDTSRESDTDDYTSFKNSPGNSMLISCNKHREGSDIKYLDACIFLDKVKDRGDIPFIQSIGRVLRICGETPEKTHGIIIDGVSIDKVQPDESYEHLIVEKIIGYYLYLENISGIEELASDPTQKKTKYDKYKEIKNKIKFETDKIILNAGGPNPIEINCNSHYIKLSWDKVIKEFGDLLGNKLDMSLDDKLRSDYLILSEVVRHAGIKTMEQYKKWAEQTNNTTQPENLYKDYGWNYYGFLGLPNDMYPNRVQFDRILTTYKTQTLQAYQELRGKFRLPPIEDIPMLYGIPLDKLFKPVIKIVKKQGRLVRELD